MGMVTHLTDSNGRCMSTATSSAKSSLDVVVLNGTVRYIMVPYRMMVQYTKMQYSTGAVSYGTLWYGTIPCGTCTVR